VETTWSYGNAPVFVVQHHGYVHRDVQATYPTYRAALKGLHAAILEAIGEIRQRETIG
jgi:hypothetical protein